MYSEVGPHFIYKDNRGNYEMTKMYLSPVH